MVEIPNNTIGTDDENKFNLTSKITFRRPISRSIADQLIPIILHEIIPKYQNKLIGLSLNPIFESNGNLIALDFLVPLEPQDVKSISKDIQIQYNIILKKTPQTSGSSSLTFTDLLGTYRVRLTRLFAPVLICILSATLLAWFVVYKADIDVNVVPFPDENNPGEILLNGIYPVIMSAIFVTVLWLFIRKFGIVVLKIIMGVFVVFYVWYGFIFFETAFVVVFQANYPEFIPAVIFYSYWILFFGSALFMLFTGYLFFKKRLNERQRNALVLTYGIFMGSIFGVSFPLWSIFAFAIFLSIWDLITVFKGPLGKIASMLQDTQEKSIEEIEKRIENGEISEEEAQEIKQFSNLQTRSIPNDQLKDHIKEMEVELGSGDLILYSALVANVFVNTSSWLTTIFVIIGVCAGAAMTIYFLITKRRMLPALPFSMFFGIAMYFIAQLILFLF